MMEFCIKNNILRKSSIFSELQKSQANTNYDNNDAGNCSLNKSQMLSLDHPWVSMLMKTLTKQKRQKDIRTVPTVYIGLLPIIYMLYYYIRSTVRHLFRAGLCRTNRTY